LNGGTLIYPALDHWIWLIVAFLIGACIGSFLNVVIYRVPLGLSVNDPKRSFCPVCKAPIPMWQNLPLVSWLGLRGKCAACGVSIPIRYFGVELLTAVVFAAVWWFFPPQVVVFLWVMAALLVAITFIDSEHLIIPTSFTWAGVVVGLAAAAAWPQLPVMAGEADGWSSGLLQSFVGWVVGFAGLWAVVELGKKAFGKKEMRFEKPVAWHLRESAGEQDPMHFVIGGEEIAWWDIFSRKSDRLLVECTEIRVDGQAAGAGQLVVRELEIELPDGTLHRLEELKSLEGTATAAVVPREAMGMGDVHLLGMIGAFFGWSGVFFTLFSASIFALLAALVGRIGFGKQLPFGPFLAMGAGAWAFGGWKLWAWYLDLLGPVGLP
jgi:leader peptidase (prepilin peptidase) / N-methyltransferase